MALGLKIALRAEDRPEALKVRGERRGDDQQTTAEGRTDGGRGDEVMRREVRGEG